MPSVLTCKCGRKVSVLTSPIGSKVKCPGCGEVLEVVAPPPPPERQPPRSPPPLPPAAAPLPPTSKRKYVDLRILGDLVALAIICAPVVGPIFAGVALRPAPDKREPYLRGSARLDQSNVPPEGSSNAGSTNADVGPPQNTTERTTFRPATTTGPQQSEPPAKIIRPETHSIPFVSNLTGVREGELPTAWIGDSAIGVRRRDNREWFENAANKSALLRPPRLILPEQFELILSVDFGDQGVLHATIGDQSTDKPLTLMVQRAFGRRITLTRGDQRWEDTVRDLAPRIRLIRDANMYRVINGDEIVFEQVFKDLQPDGELAYWLTGSSEQPLRLFNVAVLPFGPSVPRTPASQYFEDFLLVREGEIPRGWRGDPAIGARLFPNHVALVNAQRSAGLIESPPITFPSDFTLTCSLDVPEHAWGQIRLLGSTKSPDVIARIERRSIGREWVTEFTGGNRRTDRSSGPGPALIKIFHHGETFSLSLNDEKIYAHRLPDHRDFAGIEFALSGGQYPALLKQVSLTPPVYETPKPAKNASSVPISTPTLAPKKKNLTGRWNVDPTTRIDIEEADGKLTFRLGVSTAFSAIGGTAQRTESEFTGELHVVRRADLNGRSVRVPITAQIVDLNQLQVKLRVPQFFRGRWREGTWSQHLWTRHQ